MAQGSSSPLMAKQRVLHKQQRRLNRILCVVDFLDDPGPTQITLSLAQYSFGYWAKGRLASYLRIHQGSDLRRGVLHGVGIYLGATIVALLELNFHS